jgi:hypothetical protein
MGSPYYLGAVGEEGEEEMKVIIAGSRGIHDFQLVRVGIRQSGFDITEVVSGTARGVDQMGERWAVDNNVPIKKFPANWAEHGKSAGVRRNLEMARYADALLAVWDQSSNGTRNMIKTMEGFKKPVFVIGVPRK